MQTELNLAAAVEAADRGAWLALDAAERQRPSWGAAALNYLRSYATKRPAEAWMVEDVRAAAAAEGFPPAPDARAWGRVTQIARDLGLIAFAGYSRQRAKNCHGSPKAMWRAAT